MAIRQEMLDHGNINTVSVKRVTLERLRRKAHECNQRHHPPQVGYVGCYIWQCDLNHAYLFAVFAVKRTRICA